MKIPKSHSSKGLKPATLFQLGLFLSLSLTLVGFEYTTADVKTEEVVTAKMQAAEIEMVTEVEVQKPEPPRFDRPKTESTEHIENATTSLQQMNTNIVTTTNKNEVSEKVGNTDSDSVIIVDYVFEKDSADFRDSIFVIVEFMPTYEEFRNESDDDLRKIQTDAKMKQLLHSSMSYPEIPHKQGIQGTVYVSFVVSDKGEINDAAVIRGIHPDLDAEALDAVKKLPEMIPGRQRTKNVNVRFIVPVEFKLK